MFIYEIDTLAAKTFVGPTEKRRQIIGEVLCGSYHEKCKMVLQLWMALTIVRDNHRAPS